MMSRGGGRLPLGETDGETADSEMSDAGNGETFVFARSGKLQRSPVSKPDAASNTDASEPASEEFVVGLTDLFTPKSNNSRSEVVEKNLEFSRTRAGEVRKKVEELYEFIKGKHNVHHKIRLLVTGIKAGMLTVEREQQSLKSRAEKAERELDKIVNVVPESSSNSRTSKRDRDTPGDEEVSKRQKEDSGEKVETEGQSSGWQTIKNKNEKKAEKKKKEEKKKEEKKKEEGNKRDNVKLTKQRIKGDALIVQVKEGITYAELLRKVRTDPELKELGEKVVKTRRTQRGDMLFELKKDPAVKSSAFKQLVEKSLGEEASVRALSQETVIECRNLDEITTVDELQKALKAQCGLDVNAPAIRLRRAYGGTQNASIRLSLSEANNLLEKGKIKVGWSVCPFKVAPRVTKEMERCFKCMGFGHHARNCDGPDRSKLCRKCGEEGHFASDCVKPAKCMLCKPQDGNGHVTGGFNCPEYKKAKANQQ